MKVAKEIFRFGVDRVDSKGVDKTLLGGKGAGLAEMSLLGIPVPAGFTVTTEVCRKYQAQGVDVLGALWPKIEAELVQLKELFGFMPLVSVRSGAPISMPGMMDTILNVGLTAHNLGEWKARIGERAALDSYRRLIQMLGSTAFGVPHEAFEKELKAAKKAAKVEADSQLDATQLDKLVIKYKKVFQAVTQQEFPDEPQKQWWAAVEAVFKSWGNERAKTYRQMNSIPEDMGTAVNVQAMVFGNFNDDSGSGVLFSRNPSNGVKELVGEFLPNAQGEDVVAGIRTPMPISQMAALWPETYAQLIETIDRLEKKFGDMQDVEFTVQDKKLFMLQCRNGKRSALAGIRIAVDLAIEGLISIDTAMKRLKGSDYRIATQPQVSPDFAQAPFAIGISAGVGVATGVVVLKAADAVKCTEPCILVREETDPDDIAGMAAAAGILTLTGGTTSHAAVVARALNKVCIVGCQKDAEGKMIDLAKLKGHKLTLDGATGKVWLDTDVPVVTAASDEKIEQLISWALERHGVDAQVALPEGRPCRVMAAEWYGDYDMVQRLIDAMLKHGTKGVILDLSTPDQFDVPEERWLVDFVHAVKGVPPKPEEWQAEVLRRIAQHEELLGLSVAGALPDVANALWAGKFKFIRVASSLDDVLSGEPIQLDREFVGRLGGESGFMKLSALAEKAGSPIAIARKSAPAEYTLFCQLGGG